MATNIILTPGTAKSIDGHVDRVLKDLGHPEPPLCLADVRELLRLDLQYYSSTNVGWLQEKIHQLRVAGKQVLARPWLMLDVVKKLDLKALVIPDRKRILLDADQPPPKQRWNETHEIIHDLLPWHAGASLGDKQRTLSLSCHSQIECEANYGAGRLLFLGQRFRDELAEAGSVDFDTVKQLKKTFGNSLTTTLWRIVENSDGPALGLVSIHPHTSPAPGESPVRYFIRSPQFATRFPAVNELALFARIRTFCYGNRGPIGSSEIILTDGRGEAHEFLLECFHNHHDTLTLGSYQRAHATVVSLTRTSGLK